MSQATLMEEMVLMHVFSSLCSWLLHISDLQRLEREPNLAALVIANGMTICFVGYNNKTYVLESHRHNVFGPVFAAMVVMTAKPDLEEFLVNIKGQISPAFNVCSITFVFVLKSNINTEKSAMHEFV